MDAGFDLAPAFARVKLVNVIRSLKFLGTGAQEHGSTCRTPFTWMSWTRDKGAMALRTRECRQYGALPFHFDRHGAPHVYLVTSRGSGRWIIPKGNAIHGLSPHEIAAREAFEEAGLVGHVQQTRIGTFRLDRRRRGAKGICLVDAYALAVEAQVPHWAEAGQRLVRRFDLATALSLVASPSLSALIEHFMTGELRGRALGGRAGLVAA